MSSYSTVLHHRSMVFDDIRNNLYTEALRQCITPQSVVLDLGAGLGIHGLVAARLGAKRVYLVDPSPILHVAERVADANGFSDRVVCIQKSIKQVELPEKVDVIISVFTGNFLLTEDLLPFLFLARDRFLKHGGKLLPDLAQMEIAAVSVPKYYDKQVSCWEGSPQNIKYGLVREFAANSLYYGSTKSLRPVMLSEPVRLTELDLVKVVEASCRSSVSAGITKDGTCHGWLGWFKIRLGNNWLSTSPTAKRTHWVQVLMPLRKPLQVRKGEILKFELHRPESGEWTWKTDSGAERFTNSTFLSSPVMPHQLLKQTDTYRPTLSQQGQIISDVLKDMDGSRSNKEIISGIKEKYPELCKTDADARSIIGKIFDKFVD